MLRSRRKSWAMTACATSENCLRRRLDRVAKHRTALGDEDDDVFADHPLHAFDQKLGGDRVDEIGEQDDESAALEANVEFGQGQA